MRQDPNSLSLDDRDNPEPDGFVILILDLVTGESDCYGPYRHAADAETQAYSRQQEFEDAELSDVLIVVASWHAEGDGRPFST